MKSYGFLSYFTLLFACIWPTILTLFYFILLPDWGMEREAKAFYGIGKALQFILPAAAIWLGWSFLPSFNLLASLSRKGICVGIITGIAIFAFMFLGYTSWIQNCDWFIASGAKEAIRQKMSVMGVASPAAFIVLGVFYCIFHSALEEYYWRWFVYGSMTHTCSVLFSGIVSSLMFMSHHVLLLGVYFGWQNVFTYLCALGVAVGGLIWVWIYHANCSLTGAWISHIGPDAAIFTIGYLILFS